MKKLQSLLMIDLPENYANTTAISSEIDIDSTAVPIELPINACS
jgi:hypothetical protein